MAIASGANDSREERKARAKTYLLKELRSPSLILFFILALTEPAWIFPVFHALLWTFLLVPSGWPVLMLAVLFAVSFVGGLASYARSVVRIAKPAQAARRSKLAGDIEGYERFRTEVKQIRATLTSAPMWLGMIAMQFLIPIIAALIVWHGMQESPGSLRKDHGKMRYATPHEDLESTLQRMGWYPRS